MAVLHELLAQSRVLCRLRHPNIACLYAVVIPDHLLDIAAVAVAPSPPQEPPPAQVLVTAQQPSEAAPAVTTASSSAAKEAHAGQAVPTFLGFPTPFGVAATLNTPDEHQAISDDDGAGGSGLWAGRQRSPLVSVMHSSGQPSIRELSSQGTAKYTRIRHSMILLLMWG